MANVSDELLQLRKRARRRLIGAIALVIFALTFLWTVLDGEPPKNLVENHAVEIISSAPALSSTIESPNASSVAASAPIEPVDVVEHAPIEASRIAAVALPGKLVTHQGEHSSTQAEQPAVAVSSAPVVEKPVATSAPVATPKPTPTKKPQASPTPKVTEVKKAAVNPADILEGKQASATVAPSAAKKLYYIQVGAYADAQKAAELVSKLKTAGVKANSEKITTSKGELTRVRVGPTDDEAKAKAWIKAMQEMGISGALVAKAAQ